MRRLLWIVLSAPGILVACSDTPDPYAGKFTDIDPGWTVTADEAQQWALVKDANRPTITGSPEFV